MSLNRKTLLNLTGLYLLFTTSIYAQTRDEAPAAPCSMTLDGITLNWYKVTNTAALKLPAKAGKIKLPKRYTVYTADAGKLHTILNTVKNKGKEQTPVVLPLSGEIGCATFGVTVSGTMSPGLAAKYPQLASLKGQGVEDKSASVRLDYDGKEMNAEILWQGSYYLIAPWKKGTKTYYLVYKKEDSGMPRSVPAKGQYY